MPQQPSPDVAPAPAAQAVPAAPAAPAAPSLLQGTPATADPRITARQMHEAANAQREVLGNQLEQLEQRRRELSGPLQDPMVTGADRAGLEKRIGDLDTRIADVEKQIAAADANVAQTAGMAGAIPPEPQYVDTGDEPEAVAATLAVSTPIWLVIIFLLRRRWRKQAGAPKATTELATQLTRVEQSVESIALEVERIGEAQRFTARVLAEAHEPRALGAGAAEPVAARQREASPERRR